MRYFLFPLIAGLLFVLILNVIVDPSARWHTLAYAFTKNWEEKEVWVAPLRIEERLLRTRQIELMPPPDILGLGSSRLFNVEQNMFPERMRFYNLSVSGATVWDYVALWQKVKQEGKIPKHLLLYLDTWNFNKNTWQKYRWISNYDLVQDFLAGKPELKHLRTRARLDGITGRFYEFADLVSPVVLKLSFQQLRDMRESPPQSNVVMPIEKRPGQLPAWKNDGSYLFPVADEEPKTLEAITEIGRNIGKGGMYVYMKDWETDQEALELLDALLEDAQSLGVDVLIVQPPFQQEAYNLLYSHPGYKDIPKRYDAIVQQLLSTYSHVRYCDQLNPNAIDCGKTEFMDSAHTLKSCARKMVEQCLAKVPQW